MRVQRSCWSRGMPRTATLRGTNVTTDLEVRAIFQAGYFDAIDRGDFAAAASIMRDGVNWSHRAAWQQDDLGFLLQALDQFYDRDGVFKFLEISAPRVVSAGLRHDPGLGFPGRRGRL